MNLYILVEGKSTEYIIYPKWLSHILPNINRVFNIQEVAKDNYFLISGFGYPSILNHLKNSIEEINDLNIFDYFIVCMDVDESTITEREGEILKYIQDHNLTLDNCELKIILQNRCFETWLLGNRRVYSRNPNDADLDDFTRFYNVYEDDPELMGTYHGYNTHAQFHYAYLKKILFERNIKYTKKFPREVGEWNYLEQLFNRSCDSDHIKTFKDFFEFFFDKDC